MISRILDTEMYQDMPKKHNTKVFHNRNDSDPIQPSDSSVNLSTTDILANCEDDLRKLFEIYCSYGDPMNTKYLKSNKLSKIFKDIGLLKSLSKLPPNYSDAQ